MKRESNISDARYVVTVKPENMPENTARRIKQMINYEFVSELVNKSKYASKFAIGGGVIGFIYSVVKQKNKIASIAIGSIVFGLIGYGLTEMYYNNKEKENESKPESTT